MEAGGGDAGGGAGGGAVKTWRERLMPVVTTLQPAARIAERVANIAVHMQRPTLTGIVGVAGTGLSALADALGNSRAPSWTLDMFVARGVLIEAVREAGAKVVITKQPDSSEHVACTAPGMTFWIHQAGSVGICTDNAAGFVEWLKQALNRVLPAALTVQRKATQQGESYEHRAASLSHYDNEQARAILAATLPLIDGGRCILLDGRPGVGKTTMAQIIARDSGLGRVVLLSNAMVGVPRDMGSYPTACAPASGSFRDSLHALSPGVVIVDDVDKISISLGRLEELRSAARLVILTANNGQYDEVLDGALMRAGRVDEVFTVAPSALGREAPFDTLTDEEWDEVCQWPVAYVNEVRKRLALRPGELRLDDLRVRLTKKTRSGEVLR